MFDLTITFTGLCMLVRDPAKPMLHMLMPFPDGHPHFARLIFVDPAGAVRQEEIAGMDLELPGVTGSNPFNSDVDSDVFDFGSTLLERRTVLRELLDPPFPLPDSPVRTRMRLTAGQTGRPRRRGGWWNFHLATGTVSRRLPTALDWVIDDVDLTHLQIKNMAGPGTFDVFPKDGRIHLLVAHVTEKELKVIGPDIPEHSECPPDKKVGDHFGLYRWLLDPPGIATLPEFDRPKSHDYGLCATPFAATRASHLQDQAAAVAAGAAAAATAAAVAPVAPGAAATAAAAAAAAAATATAALTATAAAAGGSELTCMITTAPAG